MKKFFLVINYVALSLILAGPAPGGMILDTGPNPEHIFSLDTSQWLAGKFTTPGPQAWNVGAMQGDIHTSRPGEVNVTIYTGTDIPETVVFTKSFESVAGTGWQGTTGFAGTLAAGSYWIAFEVPANSQFIGSMGGFNPTNLPPPFSPLTLSAFTYLGTWSGATSSNLGARIEGSPVPLPSAVLLLGSGLLRLANYRRKLRKG